MAKSRDPSKETPPAAPPEEVLPEGEQSAPRGAALMAVVRWVIILGALGAATYTVGYYLGYWGVPAKVEAKYHCPMHPSVVSDRPGECPICGMNLVPIEESKHKVYAYACPIHPDYGADKPGVCPVGGEPLVSRVPFPKGLTRIHLPAERIQRIGVRTAKVARKELTYQVRTVGYVTVDERRLAHVHTRYAGWIEKLFVNETGVFVKKGQPLAAIYSNDLYLAQIEYVHSLEALGRAQSPEVKEVQQRLVEASRKRLRLLDIEDHEIRKIEKTRKPIRALMIRSPTSGHVLRKAALLGIYMKPGTELFTISNLSRVWVLADLYERDLTHVRRGQKARIRLDAYPGRVFHGRVSFFYPTVAEATRTLKVRIVLANPGLKLRPGMYANVELDRVSRKALVAPSEAIVNTGEQSYAFVALPGGVFEPRLVKVGAKAGDLTEVGRGLEEGEEVVTSANFLVDSESRLRAAIEGMTGGTGKAPGHQH